MSQLEQIIAELEPQRLEQLVLEIAGSQPPGYRSGVALGTVVQHLLADCPFNSAADRSQAYLALIDVIEKKLEQIEGMKLVRGSP